ncbi:uncharacterized protein LOC133199721 [Saccostrea echinata]|uniref:uncharacterized protein LOC133199721 n=1 Tax=Saccostrea echinata TaxID=191078 RepID=UPI002A826BE9|nr:uncharacterized protein LOC133199721 [Saccostrea echinata]
MTGFKNLISLLLLSMVASIGLAEYKLVCYYTNWSQYRTGIGKFFPPDIDPNLCTHIIYAFGKLVGNKITNFEWNDNDDWSNLYGQVNAHKEKNPNLKTLLAMGGWTAGSLVYSNMASTAENRKEFIESAIDWLRKYNFDGLDMDWEYPANRDGKPYDKANFAHLCKETREAFDDEAARTGRERLLFTAAVGAGKSVVDSAYDVPVMAQYMDFICIMTYDLHGSWDPNTGLHTGLYASDNDPDKTLNVAYAANYWHQKGAPREKLIIGLGTYGRSFTLVDASNHGVGAPASGAGNQGPYTKEKGFLSYYEICEMQKSGQGVTYRDPVAKVPYYVNPSTKLWVGFDDKTSLRLKITDLIIKDGYGGAMTWALPLDDFKGTVCGEGKYPLISLMKEVLGSGGGGGPVNPSTNQPVTNAPSTAAPTAGPTNSPVTTEAPTAGPTNSPATTQAPPKTTTEGGGIGSGFCSTASNGLHPHPFDCSLYYNCWGGVGDPMKCPDGQFFSTVYNGCDYADRVECNVVGSTSAPTNAPTTQPPATTAAPTQAPTTQGPYTEAPTVTCDGNDGRLIKHPSDCTKFIQCVHGEPVEMSCQPGLHFSVSINTCDWPANAGLTGLAEYKLVCYYTNWSQYRTGIGKFFPQDIDPNLCTHIIYAFGKLIGNKITNFEWNDNTLYGQVNAHKQKNTKLKALLAMGGWTAGSLAYSNMASTAENRKEFIESAIDWLRKYNFDGLDMDWEYPSNRDGKPYDKANFAHLCKETREAFDDEAARTGRERLLFTAAVGAGKSVVDSAYDVPVMAQYMDFICIMTYDLHGSWESKTGLHTGLYASDNDPDKTLNVAYAANYWHKKGAPREKLIIGLGTYGRSFTLVDASNHGVGAPASGAGNPGPYTKEKGFLSYYEICEMQKSGQGVTYRDPVAKVPYYVNPSTKLWVGFDDKTSLRLKITDLIIKDGYGGAMTWALPLDDFKGTICGEGKYPLISLMKEVLGSGGGGGPVNPSTSPSTAAPTAGPTNSPATTQAPPKTTTEGGGIDDSICASVSDGYMFPNNNDCTSYYQCVHKKVIKRYCQPGLYFNPANKFCDWPRNVKCNPLTTTVVTKPTTQTPTKTDPTTRPTTQSPTKTNPTTKAPTTNVPTTKAPTTTAPKTTIPSGKRKTYTCPYDGAVRDPSDCSRYYLCWGGSKLQSYAPKQCPSGQMFSNVYKVCDRADRVNCGSNPSTEAPKTNAPTTKQPLTPRPTTGAPTTKQPLTPRPTTGAPMTAVPTSAPGNPCINNDGRLLPHPSDCTKYIQCLYGSPLTRPCNVGLHFSLTHRICTWPSLAGCQ